MIQSPGCAGLLHFSNASCRINWAGYTPDTLYTTTAMLHKEFWGLIFLAFVAWVFVASTPQERIANACRPIGWAGNVVVSVSALVLPSQQATVQGYSNKVEYGCQYLTWRLFYQERYNAWNAQQQTSRTQKQVVPAPAPAPSSAPAAVPAK